MIEFKNVSMKYKTNNAVALDKVNVRIEDGEFVFNNNSTSDQN